MRTALLIGDSLSTGNAPKNFGMGLHLALAATGLRVESQAVIGSHSGHWLSGPGTIDEMETDRIARINRERLHLARGSKPLKLASALACRHPDILVIQQGTNWIESFLRDGPSAVEAAVEAWDRETLGIESRAFILPPHLSPKSPRGLRHAEALAPLVRLLEMQLRSRGWWTFDSLALPEVRADGLPDGMHYHNSPEEQVWLAKVSDALLAHLKL